MKKWIISIIILLLIIAGVLYFHLQNKNHVVIKTVAVSQGTITESAQAVGYIKPRHSTSVKSQIDGTVAELYHYEGERVTKGEPLLKVNPSPAPDRYAEAYQNLADATAKEDISKIDLDRYKHALQTGLISKSYADYIAAQKTYEVAKISRLLAAQKLALLEKGTTKVAGKNIANTVESPIDGFILNRLVDVGDAVISISSAQASTTLFTLANMHDLMFEGTVDEMDASKIKLEMPATITVAAIPNKIIKGKLTLISLQSEKENVAQGATSEDADSPFNIGFKVQITDLEFPKDITLRSGYSATANINIKTAKDVLMLPARVVHFKKEKPYVLLPSSDSKKPKEQMIETGLSDGINIEIKSGLTLNQKVLDEKPEQEQFNS